MKVAIKRHGSDWALDLSESAIERCRELGFDIGTEYYKGVMSENELRTHPVFLQVLEELGRAANKSCCSWAVVEIPFDTLNGWYVHIDYDAREDDYYESVAQVHREWGFRRNADGKSEWTEL